MIPQTPEPLPPGIIPLACRFCGARVARVRSFHWKCSGCGTDYITKGVDDDD